MITTYLHGRLLLYLNCAVTLYVGVLTSDTVITMHISMTKYLGCCHGNTDINVISIYNVCPINNYKRREI